MNNLDKWLDEMINKGLASTTSSWIERAIQQRNDKMTLNLASSALLNYSNWDKIILRMQTFN